MYSIFLKDWMQVFPRDQIFAVPFEDYKRSKSITLQKVALFLGLGETTAILHNASLCK
jgi:hypothetical protein